MTKLLLSTRGQIAALQREVEQLKIEKKTLTAQVQVLKRLKGLPEGSNPVRTTGMALSLKVYSVGFLLP